MTFSPSWAASTKPDAEFERAAALTRNSREGTLLLERAAASGAKAARPGRVKRRPVTFGVWRSGHLR